MDVDQIRRECDRNTATLCKISAWTRAGLKAHYDTRTEDQKRIDRSASVVFHSAGTNVNTVTDTVQPRADKSPSDSGDEQDTSQRVGFRGLPLPNIQVHRPELKSKVMLVSRMDAQEARNQASNDADDENIRRLVDKEDLEDLCRWIWQCDLHRSA